MCRASVSTWWKSFLRMRLLCELHWRICISCRADLVSLQFGSEAVQSMMSRTCFTNIKELHVCYNDKVHSLACVWAFDRYIELRIHLHTIEQFCSILSRGLMQECFFGEMLFAVHFCNCYQFLLYAAQSACLCLFRNATYSADFVHPFDLPQTINNPTQPHRRF